MTEVTARSRTAGTAVGFLLVTSLLLSSGIATDQARAAAAASRKEQMLALTNEARADHGKKALAMNAKVSRYATKHSREMAQAGYPFHTEDLADKLKGLDWSVGGENVGVGSSLIDLQSAFMQSKVHRKNILRGTFDHAAIGVVESDGSLWVTVIFYG
jgi:uncharacterized protein YkwD